ncbi:MAG: indole-3-glycerol phosphate synthase TrpC [Actinomycetota bacterium]
MTSFLENILGSTRARVERQIKQRSLNDLDRDAFHTPKPRDFVAALRLEGMSVIAEIKRWSPSAGEIRAGVEPAEIAASYEAGGARAISVLTEPEFFHGSLEDIAGARSGSSLPILRKDFIVDVYQMAEARLAGADAALLILAALPDQGLFEELFEAACAYELCPLIEVHDEYELERAFEVDPEVIGVNQRDLKTFEVDTSLAIRLRREIPRETVMVAESGIKSRKDVEELENAEVDAILVGEALMRAEDPARAMAELLGTDYETDGHQTDGQAAGNG